MSITIERDFYGIAPYDEEGIITTSYQTHLALENGEALSIWLQTATDNASSYEIGFQRFDSDGMPVGLTFVNIPGSDFRTWEYPMYFNGLSDGSVQALWTQTVENGFYGQYSEIRALRFTLDGDPLGSPTVLFGDGPNINLSYSIRGPVDPKVDAPVVLENGNLVLTVLQSPTVMVGSATTQTIRTVLMSPAGEILANLSETYDGRIAYHFAALPGGGFARVNTEFMGGLELQVFDAMGRPVSEPVRSIGPDVSPYTSAEQVVALTNGNIVISWAQETASSLFDGNTSASEIAARVFSPQGVPLTPAFQVNTTFNDWQETSRIVALPDGRFLIAWFDNGGTTRDHRVLDPEPGVRAQVFAADGTPSGPELIVLEWPEPDFFGGDRGPLFEDLTVLLDGSVVADFRSLAGPEVALKFTVAPAEVPTEGADDLYGLSRNDVIAALAGDDRLQGFMGNDRLDGGAGNDTAFGGDGTDTMIGGDGDDFLYGGATEADLRDVMFGGAGNDRLEAGWGNDELNGGAGNDWLDGGFGSDTMIGNDGNDMLSGGAGSDLMFGGPGNDTLNGGFGFDRMNGGTGADRFFHVGVADHGSDWVQDYSSAEGDVLVFGLAGATRAQFQINRANTPSAGSADVDEAFVIYRPTGQIMWALVDGMGQDSINVQIGGQIYDLLA